MRIMTSMYRAGCDCSLLGPVSFGRNEEEEQLSVSPDDAWLSTGVD